MGRRFSGGGGVGDGTGLGSGVGKGLILSFGSRVGNFEWNFI